MTKPKLVFLTILLFIFIANITTVRAEDIIVTKYLDNPVYNENGANNVRWPVVQYFNGLYYLFYSHSGGDTDSFYATSTDGIHFAYQGYAIKRASNTYAWDGGYIEIHTLFKYDATRWVIYYGGNPTQGSWSTGCAFSTDLITWTKYSGNPIYRDTPNAADPNVVRTSIGTYLMYYASYDSRNTWQISLATSSDGLAWTKVGVVLTYNSSISWCSYYVAPTGAWEKDGKIYLMVIGKRSDGICQNGIFVSSNLNGNSFSSLNTQPYPCIPFVSGTWESNIVAHSDTEEVNGATYVWYEAYDGSRWQLGRASWGHENPPTDGNETTTPLEIPPVVFVGIGFGGACTATYAYMTRANISKRLRRRRILLRKTKKKR